MKTWFLGIALLIISLAGLYSAYSAIDNKKNEVWWFRLIELIFSFLFFVIALMLSDFIQ